MLLVRNVHTIVRVIGDEIGCRGGFEICEDYALTELGFLTDTNYGCIIKGAFIPEVGKVNVALLVFPNAARVDSLEGGVKEEYCCLC